MAEGSVIRMADKVAERLKAAGGPGDPVVPNAAGLAEAASIAEVRSEGADNAPPAAAPAAFPAKVPTSLDEILELNVRGRKSTVKLGDVVQDRDSLKRALQRDAAYEELLREYDDKKAKAAESLATDWLLRNGLARIDPVSGRAVPVDPVKPPVAPAAPAAAPATGFDLETAATPDERRTLDALYAEDTQEGWYKAESLKANIILRSIEARARASAEQAVAPLRESFESRSRQEQVSQFVRATDEAIAGHGAVFTTPEDKILAREAVASALERGFDPARALTEVSRLAGMLSARDSRMNTNNQAAPRSPASPPPRPVGHGSGAAPLPPGPPGRAGSAPSAPTGSGRPTLGSPEMAALVRRRLLGG